MSAVAAPARTQSPAPAAAAAGLRRDLQAVKVVWKREIVTFSRNRVRMVVALVQPLLFLFVLGSGLSAVTRAAAGGLSFRTFMFPGVLALAVLMPSFFVAGSIVFDREFGFLREMLVAPVRRGSIVVGKCLGGATVATIQGAALIVLAGLVGVPYSPVMILELIGLLLLLSFALVSFGVLCAARITQFQSFMALVQLLIFPMLFLSGAMFPIASLPGWLTVLTRLDPITYAVDPLRRAVFGHLDVSAGVRRTLDPGVTLWGWHVPAGLEVGLVALIGIVLLGLAIARFETVE